MAVHVAAGQAFRTGATPSRAVMANGATASLLPNTQYTFSADVEIVEDASPAVLGTADSKRRRGYSDKAVRDDKDYEDKAIVGRFAVRSEQDDIA